MGSRPVALAAGAVAALLLAPLACRDGEETSTFELAVPATPSASS